MRTSTIFGIIIVVLIVLAGWYYWSTTMAPSAGPSNAMGVNGSGNQGNLGGTDTGAPQQPGDGSAMADNLTLGLDGGHLIAYNGMTLYTFDKDKMGTTTCYDKCAQNWPPYVVQAGMQLNLQAGVTGAANTITRADGTMQVTYKGMPLYFYAGDAASGDTKGDGVNGVWHAAK